jgi:hypothetical protein
MKKPQRTKTLWPMLTFLVNFGRLILTIIHNDWD